MRSRSHQCRRHHQQLNRHNCNKVHRSSLKSYHQTIYFTFHPEQDIYDDVDINECLAPSQLKPHEPATKYILKHFFVFSQSDPILYVFMWTAINISPSPGPEHKMQLIRAVCAHVRDVFSRASYKIKEIARVLASSIDKVSIWCRLRCIFKRRWRRTCLNHRFTSTFRPERRLREAQKHN